MQDAAMKLRESVKSIRVLTLRALPLGILLALLSPSFVVASDGYVGVFGDAAGTIRCMTAPPGVPVTLYVVAKTQGHTASGLTGAEFRIDIQNPAGYFFSYNAPTNSIALGSPLDPAGFNLSFSTCQVPNDGTVTLGTLSVFNTGTGGTSDIIVRRRNPPNNVNYPCALLVQCDAPVYTKSCNTSPSDSSACLNAKPLTPTEFSVDEYRTQVGGGEWVQGSHAYVGYAKSDACGMIDARAAIDNANPTSAGAYVCAWVTIANRTAHAVDLSSLWLQAGWDKPSGWAAPQMYFEYCTESTAWRTDLTPNGYSYVLHLGEPTGNDVNYRTYLDPLTGFAFLHAGSIGLPLPLEGFDATPLELAVWTAEMGDGGASDHTPGTATNPCDFSAVQYRTANGTADRIPVFEFQNQVTPVAAHGVAQPGTGAFYVYDSR